MLYIERESDSKMTIDWENGQLKINAPHLQHLLRAIRDHMQNFDIISFYHIYRELNADGDKLSKEALLLPPRLMEVKEYADNILINQYVRL